MPPPLPTLEDVRRAAERIAPFAHRTPVLRSTLVDEAADALVFFKAECFQRGGAFKFRGACNAVLALADDVARRGVVTHSSGNHAQALALAARLRGIPATVVVPRNAAAVKVAAVRSYGARIVECVPTLVAREVAAAEVVARTGATLIHAYDDDHVIAGQGTAALELLEEVESLELLLVPVGGGGLASGTLLAAAELAATRVVGVEPAGADDARQSLAEARIVPSIAPRTIADGLLTSLGARTFAIIREHIEEIITVDDAAIIRAMRLVWERMKVVIEPSAAVSLAALLERRVTARGRRVGIILSGGNVDLDALPW